MSLDALLTAVQTIIAHLVGGTVVTGTGAEAVSTTIQFSNSWVGMFLSTLTTSNGLLLISFILSICLFGIHCLLSLMRR